jgi:hypothetical protein
MTAENPASPEGPTNGQQNTRLLIKKGASVDVLKTHDPVEFGDDVKTAAQLRAILTSKGLMMESDQFMVEDGSFLERGEEGSMQRSGVVADEVFKSSYWHNVVNSAH